MKKTATFVNLLLVTLLLFVFPVVSHALLPSPPTELTSIFNDLGLFETAFKSGKWDEALSASGKIDATFNRMMPQLKRDTKSDVGKVYTDISTKIKKSVEQRDSEATHKNFAELHTFIFTLISKYEYKTKPVFIVINKYIAEAEEALRDKRYDRVVSEIEEIIVMFGFVENYIDSKDAKQRNVQEIKAKLNEIRAAGLNKKSESAKSGIISLKKMLTRLVQK